MPHHPFSPVDGLLGKKSARLAVKGGVGPSRPAAESRGAKCPQGGHARHRLGKVAEHRSPQHLANKHDKEVGTVSTFW